MRRISSFSRRSCSISPRSWSTISPPRSGRASSRGPRGARCAGPRGELLREPFDLLGNLLRLVVESGGTEVLQGDVEVFELRLQFGRRSGAVALRGLPGRRCRGAKFHFHSFGRIVSAGFSQLVKFAFQRLQPLHTFASASFASPPGDRDHGPPHQACAKLSHFRLQTFGLFVLAGPAEFSRLAGDLRDASP